MPRRFDCVLRAAQMVHGAVHRVQQGAEARRITPFVSVDALGVVGASLGRGSDRVDDVATRCTTECLQRGIRVFER